MVRWGQGMPKEMGTNEWTEDEDCKILQISEIDQLESVQQLDKTEKKQGRWWDVSHVIASV